MHYLLHCLPLGAVNFEPWMIAIIVPVSVFIVGGVIAVSAMHFQNQQKLAWHQTARVALEKGQPVPPMPGGSAACDAGENETDSLAKREQQQRNDLRAGLILIGVGGGLFLMLRALTGGAVQYVGAIPGFIGVAMVVHALLDRMFMPKNR